MALSNNPVSGALYFMRGLGLIMQPGIRPFVVVPLLVNTLLFVGLIWLGTDQMDALMQRLIPTGWEWLSWLLWPVFAVAVLLIVFFGFVMVGNLIAAPFNGMLAEAVERKLTGREPDPTSWSRLPGEVGRTLVSELRKIVYTLLRAVPLLILFLIPVVNVLAPFLWILFSAWLLAIQYADYPMGNHGLAFPEQRRRLKSRRLLALGFGGLAMVVLAIPVVNFLVIPTAVAGATAMWVERLRDVEAAAS